MQFPGSDQQKKDAFLLIHIYVRYQDSDVPLNAPVQTVIYCGAGNIREVLIFANFATRTNSRIQESRENYYSNSATLSSKLMIREF